MTDRSRRSWPLFLLAACSFIPGLGIVFAAMGVTWGLLADRPRARSAAALAAVGALVNFALGALLMWRMDDSVAMIAARSTVTRRDLGKVVLALEDYHQRGGGYPATLEQLVGYPLPIRFINIHDQSNGLFHRHPDYQYHVAAGGTSYDLFAVGTDGQPCTEDDLRPEVPESLLSRSGYRPGSANCGPR